jgi:septal ring factor EnvC (AmiA/AmiB activator)
MKTHDKQIKSLTEEIENFQEKYRKNKEKKKQITDEYDAVKSESDRVNLALYNTIQSYEKRIADIKDSFDNEMKEEKKRVDQFLKFNEDLRDSDLYNVYKDLRKKFEEKLKECIEYKDKSEKISIKFKKLPFLIQILLILCGFFHQLFILK